MVYYVINGVFPSTDHSLKYLEIQKLKAQNRNLGGQLFTTQTVLTNANKVNSTLGRQLFDLQTKLSKKGVI